MMRINHHHHLLFLLLMVFIVIAGKTIEGQQEENNGNFGKWKNCTHPQFISQLKSNKFNIYKPVKIPSQSFGFEAVTLPDQDVKYYSHLTVGDTFEINEFRYRGSRSLCDSDRLLETKFNCLNLCFDFGMEIVDNKTIYDWINYCQYCRNANGFDKYHEFRMQHSCNNTKLVDSKTKVLEIIESFPNDIRYCGTVNIGLPIVVGPLLDSYAFICYCEKHNRFEFECVKHGWENILKEVLDIGGLVIFCLLFFITLFILLIPKLINYFRKTPGLTFLRIIPSLALTFSSMCYIVNYSLYFTPHFAIATTFLMIAQLMQFYSLFPIVMKWYGMASLISHHHQGTALRYSIRKVYIGAAILFFIAVLFSCFTTVILPLFVIGDQFFLYTYVVISWVSEVVCISMFIITSIRVNSVLKKLSDIVSQTVPFTRLTNFSIIFILGISFIDLNAVFSKLVNDRVFLAYNQLLTDLLYCILFCRIVVFEFDFEDFKIFRKQPKQPAANDLKVEEITQELPATIVSNETSTSAGSSYYLLEN